MPTTATELNNHRSWATHYDKNPKWPSERKAEEEKQSRKSVLAQLKAARAERAAAVTANSVAAAPSVYINNVKLSISNSQINAILGAIFAVTIASQHQRAPSTSSFCCKAQDYKKSAVAALASSALPTKPLPSSTPLASMFDDEKDLEHVHGSEEKKPSVETSNKTSSSPSKKRKLPFGDDDSEGESDFEDLHRPKKPKTSTVDLDTEKYKDKKGAVKKVCQPQPRWQTLQSSSTALHRSVVQRAKVWRPSSNFRPVSSFLAVMGKRELFKGPIRHCSSLRKDDFQDV